MNSESRSHIGFDISICGATTTVTVRGCVVHGPASEGLFLEVLARCTHRKPRTIVVDLRGVEFMDAAGIGILAFSYGEARSAGMNFRVENIPRIILETFSITGLSQFFTPASFGVPKDGL